MSLIKTYILTFWLLLISISNIIAQSWQPLGNGLNNSVLSVYKTPTGDTVYAGGRFSGSGMVSINYLGRWTNNSWSNVGLGLDGAVKTIVNIDGDLYFGGEFAYSKDSLLNCIAKWDGQQFIGYNNGFFKSGTHSVMATVNGIVKYHNQLYVGGIFDYAFNKVDYMKNIARWNGDKWENVSDGVTGNSGINCMVVYHDTLYVGGGFTSSGTTNTYNIAKWDGANWSAVGNGLNNEVTSLEIHNDTLYAAGVFTQSGTTPISYVAKWNGTAWQNVGTGINNIVYSLKSVNTKLFAGGGFTKADGNACKNLAQWNGSNWSANGEPNSVVRCLGGSTYLVAGGDFSTIGSATASKVSMLNYMSGILDLNIHSTNIFPNPASSIIQINLPQDVKIETVSIYNLLGESIETSIFSNNLDISNLPNGNYFIVIKSNNGFIKKSMSIFHQ